MAEPLLPGLKNRVLQVLARIAPGATTLRVCLNRWRGVNIGKNVWIGYDSIIETSCPHLVTIRDRAAIGVRVTIIAHNREQRGVVIEEDATLGAGVIVLPAVTIGRGAMVTAEASLQNLCLRKPWCKVIRRNLSQPSRCRLDSMFQSRSLPRV
jgi:acetyltransferase-like isoleucine patch superfamily enzyme